MALVADHHRGDDGAAVQDEDQEHDEPAEHLSLTFTGDAIEGTKFGTGLKN